MNDTERNLIHAGNSIQKDLLMEAKKQTRNNMITWIISALALLVALAALISSN